MEDNKYEQFMKKEDIKLKKRSAQDIENALNDGYYERFSVRNKHRQYGPELRRKRKMHILFFTSIIKVVVYSYNYFKYGYYGDI